jgi:hypothetical protein
VGDEGGAVAAEMGFDAAKHEAEEQVLAA